MNIASIAYSAWRAVREAQGQAHPQWWELTEAQQAALRRRVSSLCAQDFPCHDSSVEERVFVATIKACVRTLE